MTGMALNRNVSIDVARGILITCVVVGHAIQKCNGMYPTDYLQSVIATFQMALFFAISGYVSCLSGKSASLGMLARRTKRLLVPYVSWVILLWILQGGHLTELPYRILHSEFWFLRVLLLVVLVAAISEILEHMLCRKWAGLVTRVCVRTSLLILFAIACEKFLQQVAFSHYLLCYMIGMVAYQGKLHIGFEKVRMILKAAVPIFFFQVILFRYIPSSAVGIWRHLMAISGGLTVCCLAHYVSEGLSKDHFVVRCLSYLGVMSLAIYAIHWNLFFVISKLPFALGHTNKLIFYLVSLSVGATWVFLSVLIGRILNMIPVISELMLGMNSKVYCSRGGEGVK